MNRYFVQHPEMILGDMVMESTRFGPDSACKAREGEDLSEQLANAIQFLQAEIKPYELEELDEEEDRSIPADPSVKNFSYTVVDSQVYYRENSLMHPVEVSVTAENRIRGMIELRECVRRLIEYQTEGYPDEDIESEPAETQCPLRQLHRQVRPYQQPRQQAGLFGGLQLLPLVLSGGAG